MNTLYSPFLRLRPHKMVSRLGCTHIGAETARCGSYLVALALANIALGPIHIYQYPDGECETDPFSATTENSTLFAPLWVRDTGLNVISAPSAPITATLRISNYSHRNSSAQTLRVGDCVAYIGRRARRTTRFATHEWPLVSPRGTPIVSMAEFQCSVDAI